jgi:hypothetical protein
MFFRKLSSAFAWWAVGLICLAAFSLMLWAARTDSAIDDELAHIPAGYGYVSQLDYRLNPEHPPFTKALAMLPILFLQPPVNFPTQSAAWQTEINGQWDMGTQFLYQSGNNANEIIQTARIFPILITILTIIFLYLLARRVLGNWWALLPTTLFAFDPTILAHGHYVTTDVGASFGVIFATYFFLKYLDKPSTKHLWWAGLAFGVAQLTKFSLPLLTVLFIFLALVIWAHEMIIKKRWSWHGGRTLWKLILMIVIGYVFVVYPVYYLFTANYPTTKQISDTTQILTSFANGPTPAGQICHGARCLADADIWMAKNPITRPYAQYLLGLLMVLQRADGGNTIYFLGHVVNSGGWIYFPTLFLLKEPLPTLIIIFLGFILAVWWIIRAAIRTRSLKRNFEAILDYIRTNFYQFSMASFVILYWGYSMHSPLNIGIRHIIPTIPFILILAAGIWKTWITRMDFDFGSASGLGSGLGFGSGGSGIPGLLNSSGALDPQALMASANNFARRAARMVAITIAKYILLLLLIIWLILETLFAAPYFLSYFNELGGGTWNGYHFVTDSNYDWGQDLLRLQSFVTAHPEIDKIAVDYFGGGDPSYYLGSREVNWSSAQGNPANQGVHWLAISINQLEGATQPLVPGETRNASDTYSWLTTLRPVAPGIGNVPTPDYRVGTSIFIYKL